MVVFWPWGANVACLASSLVTLPYSPTKEPRLKGIHNGCTIFIPQSTPHPPFVPGQLSQMHSFCDIDILSFVCFCISLMGQSFALLVIHPSIPTLFGNDSMKTLPSIMMWNTVCHQFFTVSIVLFPTKTRLSEHTKHSLWEKPITFARPTRPV